MANEPIVKDLTSIVMDEKDNVATVLAEISEGQVVEYMKNGTIERVIASESIRFGHKIALQLIPAGAEVLKYGEVIGAATVDIQQGTHVHVHNIEGIRGRGDKK